MTQVLIGAIDPQEKEKEYAELWDNLKVCFRDCNLTDPNAFGSLVELCGYYRSKLLTCEERRDFVRRMYEQTERDIENIAIKEVKTEVNTHGSKEIPKAAVAVMVKENQNAQKVLVFYGRNEQARLSLFTFLRAIGLHPFEWPELVKSTGKGSPQIFEVLKKGFSEAMAVVVLMTPDDEGKMRAEFIKQGDPSSETELTPQARLNVIFEAGMALGYCAERTILVELGALRPFSDIAGLHVVRLDNSISKRQELAQRLLTLGCAANLLGTDWHKAGDFKIPVVA
jgi:predicted nucleotide-binding protein